MIIAELEKRSFHYHWLKFLPKHSDGVDVTITLTSAPSKDFFSTVTTSSWKATSSTFLGRLNRKTLNAIY